MSGFGDKREDDHAQAAEYALGLLGRGERQVFEGRLVTDPALRALLAEWHESFAALALAIPEAQPGPEVQARISAMLFAADTRPGFSLLRFLGGVVVAASAALAVLYFVPVAPQAEFTASLASADQALQVVAAFDEDRDEMTVTVQAGGALPGRALELWIIAEGASTPVSLGVLPEAAEARLTLTPDLARLIAGGTLAISDEPPGGSPTGQPTGAVLATGVVEAA